MSYWGRVQVYGSEGSASNCRIRGILKDIGLKSVARSNSKNPIGALLAFKCIRIAITHSIELVEMHV